MGSSFFSKSISERNSDLELALKGVRWHRFDSPLFLSHRIDSSSNKTSETKTSEKINPKKRFYPAYVLPFGFFNDVANGFFTNAGFDIEAPIGFQTTTSGFLTTHYSLLAGGPNANFGYLSQVEYNELSLFIPLKLTGDFDKVRLISESGKVICNSTSRQRIYGLNGMKGVLPLILVTDTEEGLKCGSIYRTNRGQARLSSLNMTPDIKKCITDFMTGLSVMGYRASKSRLPGSRGEPIISTSASSPAVKSSKKSSQYGSVEERGDINWHNPKSIVAYLDRFVIGQEHAKRVLAVSFSNYMVRKIEERESLPISNILSIGSTGVGKTLCVSLLAKRAEIPVAQVKATGKSSEGYKGENLSTVFDYIRKETKERAPYGVVFIDELDKLADGEFFSRKLQQSLVGWLEGAVIAGDGRTDTRDNDRIDTRNLLFVTAGAFQKTEGKTLIEIIQGRLGMNQRSIGFGHSSPDSVLLDYGTNVLTQVTSEDLIAYGLMPELVGRLPTRAVFHPLSVDDKIRILNESENSVLDGYKQLLELRGYRVQISHDMLRTIVEKCPSETGARGLKEVCDLMFVNLIYEPEQYASADRTITLTPTLLDELVNRSAYF